MQPAPPESGSRTRIQSTGLFLGPAACVALVTFGRIDALDPIAQRALAVTAWVAIWWLTEPVSANATALIPFVALPVLGVLRARDVAMLYQHDVIFLFLGGSFLALGVERAGLHRRMAAGLIRAFGRRPRRFLAGYLAAVTFTSFWMSNTATTLLFIPPALELGARIRDGNPGKPGASRMAVALLIATALGSSVGGMATPIGTAPNMILARKAAEALPPGVSFASWLAVGLPMVIVLSAALYVTLAFVTCRFPRDLVLDAEDAGDPRWSPAERRTAVVFGLAVLAWLTRGDVPVAGAFTIPGWSSALSARGVLPANVAQYVTDGTVAVAAALTLFLLPKAPGQRPVLEADAFDRMPWGALVLLGSSFVLAEAFDLPKGSPASLSGWLAGVLGGLGTLPLLLQLIVIAIAVTFAGELASNTAVAALLIPIGFRLAGEIGVDPLTYGFTICFAASCSFMLPVATPPNALVYGTRLVPLRDLMRTGLALDVAGAASTALIVWAML
jgi:sodium-dependent dicarboxylate transporter 2/3/5